MQAQASAILERPTGGQYDCVCIKYGFGCIHKVSHSTWLQHLANASSEEECQRIRSARLLGERIMSLPPLANSSPPPNRNLSVPPSIRRIEALRGLAKQARENRDLNEHVGRCKRARLKQPTDINQNEDSSGIQMDANETAGHVLSQPAHPGDGAMDVNDLQSDRDPIDPIDNNFSPPPSLSQSPPQDETDPCSPPPPPPLHSPPMRDGTDSLPKVEARRRCAQDQLKMGIQSNGLTEEFQKYYTSLTSAQRQAYDDEAAALASGNNWHMKTISSGPLH
ncbi:hypothetical protein PISMIDRAFT_17120 [Pisolithus microcarpus 441]|uniref:Uncharacterized protein n=1 Tax=Pisolithus microcarpus 441 TaxID=765257 RepID=A0A0C9YWW8_9AGAM|nr:hypothetical protein PISMIDRAFT_17120 [Pisolithus microcarpus 441]